MNVGDLELTVTLNRVGDGTCIRRGICASIRRFEAILWRRSGTSDSYLWKLLNEFLEKKYLNLLEEQFWNCIF